MAISNQATQDINKKVEYTAMSRVFDLRDILELIDNGLHNRTFPQHQAVFPEHQAILHIRSEFGDQLDGEGLVEIIEQRLGEIAFVSKDLSEQPFDQFRDRLAIIDISGCEQNTEQLASVIENQVELEAIEPAGRCMTTSSQVSENLVVMDASVVADR